MIAVKKEVAALVVAREGGKVESLLENEVPTSGSTAKVTIGIQKDGRLEMKHRLKQWR